MILVCGDPRYKRKPACSSVPDVVTPCMIDGQPLLVTPFLFGTMSGFHYDDEELEEYEEEEERRDAVATDPSSFDDGESREDALADAYERGAAARSKGGVRAGPKRRSRTAAPEPATSVSPPPASSVPAATVATDPKLEATSMPFAGTDDYTGDGAFWPAATRHRDDEPAMPFSGTDDFSGDRVFSSLFGLPGPLAPRPAAAPAEHKTEAVDDDLPFPFVYEEDGRSVFDAVRPCYSSSRPAAKPAAKRAARAQPRPPPPKDTPILHPPNLDVSRAALERLFEPHELPASFVVGARLYDVEVGLEATVVGVDALRERPRVLFLDVAGAGTGPVPFVPDWVFLSRWVVLPPEAQQPTLQPGAGFVVPPAETIVRGGLHATGYVAPLPVDVSALPRLGLRQGTVLRCEAAGGTPSERWAAAAVGRTYWTVGVHFDEASRSVCLLLRDEAERREFVAAPAGATFTVLGRDLKGMRAANSTLDIPEVEPDGALAGRELSSGCMDFMPSAMGMSRRSNSVEGAGDTAGGAAARRVDSTLFPVVDPANAAALDRVRKHAATVAAEARFLSTARSKLVTAAIAKDEADADRVMQLIERMIHSETPVTMWFHATRSVRMPPPHDAHFVDQPLAMTHDTVMRNLMELNGEFGSGCKVMSTRMGWERVSYQSAYEDHHAPHHVRPKYGVLNIFNDPSGWQTPGDKYGDCLLVFVGVRPYCTFSVGDTGDINCADNVACLQDSALACAFSMFPHNDFETVARMAKGETNFKVGRIDFAYKEAQLHCSAQLHRHVSHLVVHPKFERACDPTLLLLLQFAHKNAVFLISRTTMMRLTKMRLWSTEQLTVFCRRHALREYERHQLSFHRHGGEQPQLAVGPQTPESRRVFDVIVDYLCVLDMARLTALATQP